MIDYICPSIFLIAVGYFVYQYIQGSKIKKVYTDYKNILDSKLLPLGFARQQEHEDMREKEVAYKKNSLVVTLYSAPGLSTNEIQARSGKKITAEERDNQMLPGMSNKVKYMNEQDKSRLVDALDFKIELSESEVVKEQLLRTLDKWLSENQ